MSRILQRIVSQLGCTDLLERAGALAPSDLSSLILELSRIRTDRLKPSDLVERLPQNRFAAPSALDPAAYHALEAEVLTAAKADGVRPVLLSPVAPLGSCSVLGSVSQDKILSAVRGTEVLADSTNMLAIVLAAELKERTQARPDEGLHLCATSRLTRAQPFSGPAAFAHFGLFGMVSSGRDTGCYGCESALLEKQLTLYRRVVRKLLRGDMAVVLRRRQGYPDGEGFFNRMNEHIRRVLPGIPLSVEEAGTDNPYYLGLNFKLYADRNGERLEIGDGGFTDWTQKMLNNKKERLLISGVSLDRLMILREERIMTAAKETV